MVVTYGTGFAVKPSMRQRVDQLERELLAMPQADIKTVHRFLPGIYERTITIPAWTVLTGAEHKTDYRVRLEKGVIAVNTDDGMKILSAPFAFDAKAGMKRVGRVLDQDVIWTDIYVNEDDCTDLAVIEARIYELAGCELGENKVSRLVAQDRDDYTLFLSQMGMDQGQMDNIVMNDSDIIPMPDGWGVELRASRIHGQGMFAKRAFRAGDLICPGRIDGKRTPAGRFINHTPNPNAATHKDENGDLWARAVRAIQENEEIVIDYRNSMRVNFGLIIQGEKPCLVG